MSVRRVSRTGAAFRVPGRSLANSVHEHGAQGRPNRRQRHAFFPTTVGRLPAKCKPLQFAFTAHSNSSSQTRNNRRADKAFERLVFLRPPIHETPRTGSGRGHHVTAEDIPQNPAVRGQADRSPLSRTTCPQQLSGDPADADDSQDTVRCFSRDLSRKNRK